jgi:hypothetical protein
MAMLAVKELAVRSYKNDLRDVILLTISCYSTVQCGNGKVDQGEECDGTENCSAECKCQTGTSDGTKCVVGDVQITDPPASDSSALIGGLVGGVGGALVAGAIVLIILAAKGKLKKKKKEDREGLNKDVEAGSVYGPIGGAESKLANKSVEMRKC